MRYACAILLLHFGQQLFACCIIDKSEKGGRENATILYGKWGWNRTGKCRSTCLSMRVFMQAGRRRKEEWEACPLQRAVYFVCSTAALAYAAARTVRMINMRGLLVQCLPSSPVPLYVIYDEICQTANTLSTHRHTHTHLSTHMNNLMNVNSTHEFALLAFLFNLSQRQREREREGQKEKEWKLQNV